MRRGADAAAGPRRRAEARARRSRSACPAGGEGVLGLLRYGGGHALGAESDRELRVPGRDHARAGVRAAGPAALLPPPRAGRERRRDGVRARRRGGLDRERGARRALRGRDQPVPGRRTGPASCSRPSSSTGSSPSRRRASPSSSPTATWSARSRSATARSSAGGALGRDRRGREADRATSAPRRPERDAAQPARGEAHRRLRASSALAMIALGIFVARNSALGAIGAIVLIGMGGRLRARGARGRSWIAIRARLASSPPPLARRQRPARHG